MMESSPVSAGQYWELDAHRFPAPLSPFAWSLHEIMGMGLRTEAGPRRTMLVNGYRYSLKWPPITLPDIDDSTAMQQARAAVAALPDRWHTRLRPELEGDLHHWRGLNLPLLSKNDFFRVANVTVQRHIRHWAIHDEAIGPVIAAGALLESVLDRIYGPVRYDPTLAARLVLGEDNLSWALARALAALADVARPSPEVMRALSDAHADTSGVLARLETSAAGQDFLAALRAFLDQYGYRSSAGEDYADPLWREDPGFVLAAVRSYAAAPPFDDASRRARLREERDALEVDVRAQTTDSELAREFGETLALARAAWPVREDHSFYIEQQSVALVRTVFLEAGRRLTVRGLLEQPDTIFFLTCAEVMGALAGRLDGDPTAIAAHRCAEYAAQRRSVPPPSFGTPPPEDAREGRGWRRLLQRQALGFEGAGTPIKGGSPLELRGTPVSTGIARGPVRVVRGPGEFGSVRPGDVLVCPTTTPPWSPLFGIVAALVTEAGGILSHAAIMAREYGIPAVAAVPGATRALHDGQTVTVDGASGEVRLFVGSDTQGGE